MGSIMSAIRDDIETYEALCEKYGEKVQYTHGGPDCYGAHATALKKRRDDEWLTEKKKAAEGPASRFDREDPV